MTAGAKAGGRGRRGRREKERADDRLRRAEARKRDEAEGLERIELRVPMHLAESYRARAREDVAAHRLAVRGGLVLVREAYLLPEEAEAVRARSDLYLARVQAGGPAGGVPSGGGMPAAAGGGAGGSAPRVEGQPPGQG